MAVVHGEDLQHPTGYYALRYSRGSKLIFESLKGISPVAAEARRARKEAQLSVVFVANKVELKVEPIDPQRKLLAAELKQFLADTMDRGSLEAAQVYELACDEFLKVTGRRYVDELIPADLITFQKALTARGMSARTVSNRHASLTAFLRYCGIDTKELPKAPKYDKTMPEIYMDKELKGSLRRCRLPKRICFSDYC